MPERRMVELGMELEVGPSLVANPAELARLEEAGLWVRRRDGTLQHLGSDRGRWVVEADAAIITGPPPETLVAVQVEDLRADRSAPVQVAVDGRLAGADGLERSWLSLPMGHRVELRTGPAAADSRAAPVSWWFEDHDGRVRWLGSGSRVPWAVEAGGRIIITSSGHRREHPP